MSAEEARRRHAEGEALLAAGDHAAALARFAAALALDRHLAAAHLGRANALAYLGRPAEALAGYDRFIALEPRFAPAHNNRGHALERLGRPAEALASFETAIALRPDYAAAHSNRGNALRSLGRPREALASLDRALQLRPDFPQALSDRGNALVDLGRLEAGLESYDAAIAIAPGFADARRNRGAALCKLGRPAEAVASYAAALELDPRMAQARLEMALARLLLGDFERGWRDYEARKVLNPERYGWLGRAHDFVGDRDIAGETLLVVAEHGLGDTIHFARYIAPLARRGARLVFCVQPELSRLLGANLEGVSVVDRADEIPGVCCALMSLPLALGGDPFVRPEGYLAADADLARRWEARLAPRTRRRVGFAWAGSPVHKDDRSRSIELGQFAPLLARDAEWVCLQRDLRPGDAEALRSAGIAFLGDALTDFAETAALIDRLDLVITVDTSVAHLAGAMGKPVWILLPLGPDWRWLMDRADSPLYASARLFRQTAHGDWSGVVAAVARQLASTS